MCPASQRRASSNARPRRRRSGLALQIAQPPQLCRAGHRLSAHMPRQAQARSRRLAPNCPDRPGLLNAACRQPRAPTTAAWRQRSRGGQQARHLGSDHQSARPEGVVRPDGIERDVGTEQRGRHRRECARGGQPQALMGSCHAPKVIWAVGRQRPIVGQLRLPIRHAGTRLSPERRGCPCRRR